MHINDNDHGLKEVNKRNVRIFVSHRIDMESCVINNGIYYPVRCGAAFDVKKGDMAGDNTGENISEKRDMYGELTVQYWAWKNQLAAKYGLCHYRRYLSFEDAGRFHKDVFNMIREVAITEKTIKKHRLSDGDYILHEAQEKNIIVGSGADVRRIEVKGGKPQTVKELWEAHDGIFLEKKYIDILIKRIREMRPDYYADTEEYFGSVTHYGFNCFLMDRDLFFDLCEFQFPVLFSLEEDVIKEGYSGMKVRTLGYLGEMMYGIFVYSMLKRKELKTDEKNIVLFMTTSAVKGKVDYAERWIRVNAKNHLMQVSLLPFPRGSKRRDALKKLLRIH